MENFVKSIEATGIYGRFDLRLGFSPGINVLYGVNGSGKTTLLHILTNILNADYERFVFLPFHTIVVQLERDYTISLQRAEIDGEDMIEVQINGESIEPIHVRKTRGELRSVRKLPRSSQRFELEEQERRKKPLLASAYFPAFRTMIEAWDTREEYERESARYERFMRNHQTLFARELFGEFVPLITFPSPLDIEKRLSREIGEAEFSLGRLDQSLLSQAFIAIFAALRRETNETQVQPEDTLRRIKTLFDNLQDASSLGGDVYAQLHQQVRSFPEGKEAENAAILNVYRESLEKRVVEHEKLFRGVNQYLNSVNAFLDGKDIVLYQQRPLVAVKFDDGSVVAGLSTLSSGERQIVTMIYAATHMSSQQVVLIDEPEISLHIDWQRMLLRNMEEQLQDRQIIVCTHSPSIGADYEDRIVELHLLPTRNSVPTTNDVVLTEEEEIPF